MPLLAGAGRALAWVAAGLVMLMPLVTPGSPLSLVRAAMTGPVLSITGSSAGLVPGRPAALLLTLHNPADSSVVVHAVSARVTGHARRCPASALSIDPWSGEVVVPAHGQRSVPLSLLLSATGTDCAGTTWQLRYTSV